MNRTKPPTPGDNTVRIIYSEDLNIHLSIIIGQLGKNESKPRFTARISHLDPAFRPILAALQDCTDEWGTVTLSALYEIHKAYQQVGGGGVAGAVIQEIVTYVNLNYPSVLLDTMKYYVEEAKYKLSRAKLQVESLEMEYSKACIDYDACEICHEPLGESVTSLCKACQNVE